MNATEQDILSHSLRAATDTLLHRLKKYLRARARSEEPMPDNVVIEWLVFPDKGQHPIGEIIDTIRSHPEMWRDALPADVCIVPRSYLAKFIGPTVDHLAHLGEVAVRNHAALYRHELDRKRENERS